MKIKVWLLLIFYLYPFHFVDAEVQPKQNTKLQKLGKRMLIELFPEDKQLIRKLSIEVLKNPEANSVALLEDGHWSIRINDGLLKFIGWNSDSLRFILAHEFSHLKKGHRIEYVLCGWFNQSPDFEVLEVNELSADNSAIEALLAKNYTICPVVELLQSFTNQDTLIDQSQLNDFEKLLFTNLQRISEKRLANAKTYCR